MGATGYTGRALAPAIPAGAAVVRLVGTPHPNPAKAFEFRSVDLASTRAVTSAARLRGAAHLVCVSAAHPAPVMRAYHDRRAGAGHRDASRD